MLRDGEVVDLGGRIPSELLALLVIDANTVVSTDHLVDVVWRGDPPLTARKSLQVHISRLRRQLGDGVLVTHGLGYVVHVDPGQLDATDFADLVDSGRDALHAGRPREASDRLRQALGLWRGAALAGMSDEPFARSCAARLEDLRLAAVELRIEADLSLHRHTSLVGELDTLVAEHPYREGFQRQLMLALYRSGRQADALAAYRSTRQRLVNELGVEPSRELKELHAAILSGLARKFVHVSGGEGPGLGGVGLG